MLYLSSGTAAGLDTLGPTASAAGAQSSPFSEISASPGFLLLLPEQHQTFCFYYQLQPAAGLQEL